MSSGCTATPQCSADLRSSGTCNAPAGTRGVYSTAHMSMWLCRGLVVEMHQHTHMLTQCSTAGATQHMNRSRARASDDTVLDSSSTCTRVCSCQPTCAFSFMHASSSSARSVGCRPAAAAAAAADGHALTLHASKSELVLVVVCYPHYLLSCCCSDNSRHGSSKYQT
jgi:hypothetical protein